MGRKRKDDAPRGAGGAILTRYKDGARRESRAETDRMTTYAMKARRAEKVIKHIIQDQRFATMLGEMLLLGHPRPISAKLYAAGEFAQRAFEAYDRLVLGVQRTPKSANLLGVGGASLAEDPEDETIERVTKRVMQIEGCLGGVSRGVCACTKALLRDEPMSLDQIDAAIVGLKAIALAFKIEGVSDNEIDRGARRHRFIGEDNLAEALRIE